MDEVKEIYNNGKLLLRAMDQPIIKKSKDIKYYDCSTWVDEFTYLKNEGLFSLSTTLIIPEVGVKTYKNIGFLIDASRAYCHHIAKEDSGSCGNYQLGDFMANKPDFYRIEDLASYVKLNNATVMNEVNVNVKLDAIKGLVINKCNSSFDLLKRIFIVRKMLENLVGVIYPVYLYDWNNGKLDLIDISKEIEDEIIDSLDCDIIRCWPDDVFKPYFISIESIHLTK